MDGVVHDLRFAWSLLRKRSMATFVVVGSVALGLGANLAVFSFASALLYRPLTVADPDSLVRIFTTTDKGTELGHSTYPDYVDLRDRATAFTGVAAYFYFPMALSADGSPEVILGQLVSANYFEVMGVRPALGRSFRPEEDRLPEGDAVAILSHRLWTRRFGADPSLVGRTVLVNSYPFTVIGVAPDDFTSPNVVMVPDVWVPVTTVRRTLPYPVSLDDRFDTWLLLAGRLRPDWNLASAQAATDTLAAELAGEHPASNDDRGFRLVEADRARVALNDTTDQQARMADILLCVVGFVLLVACLNVANLNLAAAVDRRREIALRRSLGASRSRLLRQLLTESVLVAGIAGGLALLVASWTIGLLLHVQTTIVELPIELDARIDWRTLGFGALLAFGGVLVFGLLPAWQALRQTGHAALRDSGWSVDRARGIFRLQGALVMGQVALSFALLVSAGLFLRSLTNTLAVEPGFDTDRGVIVPVDLGFGHYDEAAGRPFMRRMLREVEALPGISAASLSMDLPLGQMHMHSFFEMDDLAEGVSLRADAVGPRYFETLGIPIVSGRAIDERDREGGQPAAVINQTMARRFWPGQDPLGRSFRSFDRQWTIVGVARDGKYDSLSETPQAFFWVSLFQAPWLPRVNLLVRTTAEPAAMLQPVTHVLRTLDPNVPIQRATTTEAFFQSAVKNTAGPGRLLAVLGALALILAIVGTYGLMSYLASQRRQEFGIRMALGADAARLSRLVFTSGLRLGLGGAAGGLLLSALLSRMIGSFLFGVRPLDPAVLLIVAAIMALATGVACYGPARSAGRVDPVVSLRAE